jgi:protein TonB
MADTMTPSLWPVEPHGTRRFIFSLLAALVLEAAAVGALIPLVSHAGPPAGQPAPVKLTIVAPPAPPKPPTPVPPPPKPVVPPPPLPVAPPIPMPPPPPHPMAHHITRHYVPPPKPLPVQPPPPPQVETPLAPVAPPAPPAPSDNELSKFTAGLRAAVQSVAREPSSAMIANETGQPLVTFTYEDGHVTNVTLARSCGFPLLDQAALDAARNAPYPPPPPGFAGRTYNVTVVVVFQGGQTDVSGD